MNTTKFKKEIPIFFATDDNYAPFLAVALKSLLENASKDYFYKVYVLTTNLSLTYKLKLHKGITHNASIEFISLKNELDNYQSLFHLRDYYSKETYYRFFIAHLFPQYDKVLYLDCDIIVLGDISELYNTNVEDYLLAGAPEEVMTEMDVFGNYVEKTLDLRRETFFNAGILLINTKRFREEKIEEQFVELINEFKFTVTQDEDYLNVLCKNKTRLIDLGWNKTAFRNPKFDDADLKIVHYKIHWKPWHYSGVEYEEYFWKYAKKTEFYHSLLKMRDTYTDAEKKRDADAYENLMARAAIDAADPNNYRNTLLRRQRKCV